MPSASDQPDHESRMACMEVWGGCDPVAAMVKLAGHGVGISAIALVFRDLMRRFINFIDQADLCA